MTGQKADKVFYNGRLITMEGDALAQAIAIRGDKILYVGSNEEALAFAGEDTQRIDLEGRVAAPGLIESHTHAAASGAQLFLVVDMRNVFSLEEMLQKIREQAAKTPKGQWIICHRYDESKFREPAAVTAQVLDSATSEHPVFALRTCGHIAVVNSMAARLSGFLWVQGYCLRALVEDVLYFTRNDRVYTLNYRKRDTLFRGESVAYDTITATEVVLLLN